MWTHAHVRPHMECACAGALGRTVNRACACACTCTCTWTWTCMCMCRTCTCAATHEAHATRVHVRLHDVATHIRRRAVYRRRCGSPVAISRLQGRLYPSLLKPYPS